MDYVFRNLGNGSKVDLVTHIKQKINERIEELKARHPNFNMKNDIEIYVGCDSQNAGSSTIYGLVVVLHYGNNGGHVVYSKMKFNRIRDSFTRLYKEVEMSLEVARFLEKEGIKAKYIDIDINPDPKYRSNSVLRSAMGLVESYGFDVRVKPNACAASYVADWICH